MNTLITAPLAPLLTKLFADAEASTAKMRAERANLPANAAGRNAQSADYMAFYSRFAADVEVSMRL